jgi:hypothetical protein
MDISSDHDELIKKILNTVNKLIRS